MSHLSSTRSLRRRLSGLFSVPNRHLLSAVVKATFKVTDQNSILGLAWSLLMPIFFTVIMYFLFRNRFAISGQSYILFIMVGVSTVGFFLNAITAMTTALTQNRDLILNTAMPRETLFFAAMAVAMTKYLMELLTAFIAALFIAKPLWGGLPLIFPLLLGLSALTLGIGFIMGMVSCSTRDINYIWMLISRVLLFATPVFYPLQRLSPLAAKVVYYLNPLSPFLVALRKLMLGNTPDPLLFPYVHSLIVGTVALAIGYGLFVRFENAAVERA